MKLFDPHAALAEIEKLGLPAASFASFASNTPDPAPKEASEAKEAALTGQFAKTGDASAMPDERAKVPPIGSEQLGPTGPVDGPHRHGTTFDGTPKTWTGKVVSLAAWRQLSEWEKHGPNGKHWNGITQLWEIPE
jgi:hypothetical protein